MRMMIAVIPSRPSATWIRPSTLPPRLPHITTTGGLRIPAGRSWVNANLAIADYTRAIELNPAYADAYGARGTEYFGQGDTVRSVSDLSKSIELMPTAAAYAWRCVGYSVLGDAGRAFTDCDMAIQADPENALAYAMRGSLYFDQGRRTEAIADLRQALKLGQMPDSPYAYVVPVVLDTMAQFGIK